MKSFLIVLFVGLVAANKIRFLAYECMGDKISNCASYPTSVCFMSEYRAWAKANCCVYCGYGRGIPPLGGTKKRSGAMTGGLTTCADKLPNCAAYTSSVCSDSSYTQWVTENCAAFCNKCGESECADKLPNCASYDPSVCTSADYTQWSQDNCAKTCNKCAGGSTMTGTGTGNGGVIGESFTGCVYKGQVYQQGQTWKDGCKFSCTCVDGSTGKYQCTQLCVSRNLPDQCTMTPPPAGKCCPTPNCPPGFNIQYPAGYVAQ